MDVSSPPSSSPPPPSSSSPPPSSSSKVLQQTTKYTLFFQVSLSTQYFIISQINLLLEYILKKISEYLLNLRSFKSSDNQLFQTIPNKIPRTFSPFGSPSSEPSSCVRVFYTISLLLFLLLLILPFLFFLLLIITFLFFNMFVS